MGFMFFLSFQSYFKNVLADDQALHTFYISSISNKLVDLVVVHTAKYYIHCMGSNINNNN